MYYLTVSRVLQLVSIELDRYIQDKLSPHLGGLNWINVLQQLDISRGKSVDSWEYKASDLSMQLRMLTERLGNLGFPFDFQDRNRTCSSYGSVLRLIRNRWAHNDEFQAFDALQTVEISYALLSHIGAKKAADEVSSIRTQLLESLGNSGKGTTASPSEQEDGSPTTPHQPPSNVDGDGSSSKNNQGKESESTSTPTVSYTNECEEWTQIIVGEQSELDSMRSTRTKEMVRSLIEDIVSVEGPVSPERVSRLVGQAFGFSRLSKARVAQIKRQYPNANVYQDKHGFLWPLNIDPEAWELFRTLGHRDFLEVSPHELANAMTHIDKSSGHQKPSEELRKDLLHLYGRKRETTEVKKHLDVVASVFSK